MPRKLVSAARKRAGRRGLSAFVARAVARELEREALGEFLSELLPDDVSTTLDARSNKLLKRTAAP